MPSGRRVELELVRASPRRSVPAPRPWRWCSARPTRSWPSVRSWPASCTASRCPSWCRPERGSSTGDVGHGAGDRRGGESSTSPESGVRDGTPLDSPRGDLRARTAGRRTTTTRGSAPSCGTPLARAMPVVRRRGAAAGSVLPVVRLRHSAPTVTAGPPLEERRLVTIVFADLAGFTEHSDQADPEDVRRHPRAVPRGREGGDRAVRRHARQVHRRRRDGCLRRPDGPRGRPRASGASRPRDP